MNQTANGTRVAQALQSREKCRLGWRHSFIALADMCVTYIQLAGRNPRAGGVGAWVIDEAPLKPVAKAYGACK